MHVIVNARGNCGKRLMDLFHPLSHLCHSNSYLGTNPSSPPTDDNIPINNPTNAIPCVPPAHACRLHTSGAICHSPPTPSPSLDVNNTPLPPSPHIAPAPSSSRGNRHIQFQLSDDDDSPNQVPQVTKKRTAVKVVMIGLCPKAKSNTENATDGAPSGRTNGKGKGKAMPKPKDPRT